MYSGYISTNLPDLTLIWRFWPKFDLFWPQNYIIKVMIHTSPESQRNFHSLKVYVIHIRPLDVAEKPFLDFSSDCSRAPPRGRQTLKLRYNKLQIKGFHMRYDSWGWRHRWRLWLNGIYWIFWWVFSLFHLRNVHLRPKFLYGNDRKSHADLLIYKSEKMSLFDQKILEVANRISFNFSVEYSISRESDVDEF